MLAKQLHLLRYALGQQTRNSLKRLEKNLCGLTAGSGLMRQQQASPTNSWSADGCLHILNSTQREYRTVNLVYYCRHRWRYMHRISWRSAVIQSQPAPLVANMWRSPANIAVQAVWTSSSGRPHQTISPRARAAAACEPYQNITRQAVNRAIVKHQHLDHRLQPGLHQFGQRPYNNGTSFVINDDY
jgi:hypothetical protein